VFVLAKAGPSASAAKINEELCAAQVEASEPDEDGEPVSTMVVDWTPVGAHSSYTQSDPWAAAGRQDQRTAVLRLKRVVMEPLADQGVELLIPPEDHLRG
jgi:hypothetical protein